MSSLASSVVAREIFLIKDVYTFLIQSCLRLDTRRAYVTLLCKCVTTRSETVECTPHTGGLLDFS